MSAVKNWILAARPKTLPAAVVPVVLAGAMASSMQQFRLLPWLICLVFSILVQIATNFANDYYDFIKGADDERRIGPSRAVASGWISPGRMKAGMLIVFAMAFVSGCLLIPFGGWSLLFVGILSIACGIAYTGGPYPLGYNGWGDVFVFVFFGWVATGFTFFVQTGTFVYNHGMLSGWGWTLLAGAVPGALATNLLVVNNVRDAPLDGESGKRTLVVRLGRPFGIAEYAVMSLISAGVPLLFARFGGLPGCYIVLLLLPLHLKWTVSLSRCSDRVSYNSLLAKTAVMLILGGGLFAAGMLI